MRAFKDLVLPGINRGFIKKNLTYMANSEPCQTSKMELFAKNVNN